MKPSDLLPQYDAPSDQPSAPIAFTIRRPSELLAMQFNDADMILGDHLLMRGGSLAIFGAAGVGKSRLILQMATACLSGRRFLGLETRGENLRWLVIQGENSNRRLKSDLEKLKLWSGPCWPNVEENLHIHTIESDRDAFLNLDAPENYQKIARVIEQIQPDIVVFDTVNCFASGDLNSDRDMRDTIMHMAALVRKGAPFRSIIVLHHAVTGKSGALKAIGFDRGSFGRNSKALLAWCRGAINIAQGSADDNGTLVVACGKCSDGREFPRFAIKLDESMIYKVDPDFDFETWEGEVSGKNSTRKIVSMDTIKELCVNPIKKTQLVKAIMEEEGIGKSYAYKLVEKASKLKAIHYTKANKTFVAA